MNNNWEEEVKSVPRYLGCNELELASEMNQILIKELTKKEQEHKAELEMIKGEVQKLLETLPELESDEYDAGLLDMKQLVLAILDSHINKLSTY